MNEKIEILDNDENQNVDDFYSNFREKLIETHTFPTDYMFKFILSSDQSNIAKVHSVFEKANASFSSKDSKTGKYLSITVKVAVNDADDVIIYYRQIAEIKGVVML